MVTNLSGAATVVGVATALLGAWIALSFLLRRPLQARRIVTVLHGLGAAATLGLLLWERVLPTDAGATQGANFLAIGFWMLVPAAGLGGLALASRRSDRSVRELAIGAHATLAVFAVAVLLAANMV